MNGAEPLPADKAKGYIMVAIPSFGMVSIEFMNSIMDINFPTNTNRLIYWPRDPQDRNKRWMPVDQARNMAVREALRLNCKYILFRDDDVLTTDSTYLIRLMARDVDIVAGVYCVKQDRPRPLIYYEGENDGSMNWKYGDFITCDATGMGCTLIKTEIFRNIPEPWFRTVTGKDQNDPVGKLADYFTEDLYFCYKARQAGYKIHVDTGIQCLHQDVKLNRYYCFDPIKNLYGFLDGYGSFRWIPTGEEIAAKKRMLEATSGSHGPIRLDLGAGSRREGYLTVDGNPDCGCDETGDITNIDWLVAKYGKVDEVYSSHALEHLPMGMEAKILNNWICSLKPGGKLNVGVPDLEWCMKDWLATPEDDPEKHGFKKAKIFGLQTQPGHEHKTGFTIPFLKELASQLPLKNAEVVSEFNPQTHNQPTLWLRGNAEGVLPEEQDARVRFDLGCNTKTEGWISADVEEGGTERGDVRKLDWLVAKYGKADEIQANHVLEHISHAEVPAVLQEWIEALKEEGHLQVIVPDLEWMMQNFLSLPQNDPKREEMMKNMFGWQRTPLDAHKTGFTFAFMKNLFENTLHLKNMKVFCSRPELGVFYKVPEGFVQVGVIIATGYKDSRVEHGKLSEKEKLKLTLLEPRKNDSDGNGKGTREQIEGAVDLAQGVKT